VKPNTVTLTIDGRTAVVPKGKNLIEAAKTVGIEIPHFCYHPALSISGNCRICMVEIEGPRGKALSIACNTTVSDGMKVETASPRVLAARKGVMEFLLLNHPTDCPICDQVGECRLHDYYMMYDLAPSRMKLAKVKKSKAINAGPTLVLDQERCITCVRCVRFVSEITKTYDVAVEYRGDHSRISLPPGREITHKYSECMADTCPVGAFTQRKFRFKKRVYFLKNADSICPWCSRGCNIIAQFDSAENRLYRLKPRFNDDVNKHWMCDVGRWCFSEIQAEKRLASAARKNGEALQWNEAVKTAAKGLSGAAGKCFVVGTSFLSNEDVYALVRLGGKAGAAAFAHHPKPGGSEWEQFEDDLLIKREKSPNSRGAETLGLGAADYGRTLGALLDDLKAGKYDCGVVVGRDLSAFGHEVEDALSRLNFLLVIDATLTRTVKSATVAFPMATCFEREGTYVNGDGRVQRFAAAVTPPGGAKAPFEILGAILDEMSPGGERAAWTAQNVFAMIRRDNAAFAKVADAELGAFGAPLELK